MNKKDAREQGFETGYEIASEHFPDVVKENPDLTKTEIIDAVVESASIHEAEVYRQYSPFEQLASEMNKARNPDALWEAYENGVYKGARQAAKELAKNLRKGFVI